MKTLSKLILAMCISLSITSAQVITIAEAIEDLNGDFIPDRFGDTVTIQGINFSPNYGGYYTSYFIDDGTAATRIWLPNFIVTLNLGDEVQLTGIVNQFYGANSIGGLDSTSLNLLSTGNPLPAPTILSITQYMNDPESLEGSLIGFTSLTMVGGTWPTPGNGATVQISDGIDTLDMRIDPDTEISYYPEPNWPKDIIGIGDQHTSSSPPNDGYQLLPRFYSDFLPPGTIPVELTSFTINIFEGKIILQWTTATENNNQGFEVQRRIIESEFENIGFVPGFGTTTEPKSYSFIDSDVSSGKYSYRLKQIDFDGSFEYSDEVEVEINNLTMPVKYSLLQNYPNPFNPRTVIEFTIPQKEFVSLIIYDVLGNEVATLVNEEKVPGSYEVSFNAAELVSGVYVYSLRAGSFTQSKKMSLMK